MTTKRKLILFIPAIVLSIFIYGISTHNSPAENSELELYFKAAEAYDDGDFNSTLNLTTALSDKCPSFFQARLLLGKAQFFSGLIPEAEETLEKLIDDKKNYYEAEIWNLRCKIQTDDIVTARVYGEELLSRSPEDPRILGMLAGIAALENDYQQALELYKRASLFEEVLAINRVETAKVYLSLFNDTEAAIQLNKAAELAIENSPIQPALINLINNFGDEK